LITNLVYSIYSNQRTFVLPSPLQKEKEKGMLGMLCEAASNLIAFLTSWNSSLH